MKRTMIAAAFALGVLAPDPGLAGASGNGNFGIGIGFNFSYSGFGRGSCHEPQCWSPNYPCPMPYGGMHNYNPFPMGPYGGFPYAGGNGGFGGYGGYGGYGHAPFAGVLPGTGVIVAPQTGNAGGNKTSSATKSPTPK